VPSPTISLQRRGNRTQTGLTVLAMFSLAIFGVMSLRGGRVSAQDFPALVGRIEGDDVSVATVTPAGVETNAAPTVVASGSVVTIRSGHALLLLNSGGAIGVCAPARFKLVKSAGAITLALDYGRVHPALDSEEIFTIYTPTIVATPIAISGTSRDLTLGLDPGGEMCAVTTRGAMRVDPQFSDQSLIIPQGGVATLAGGQIESLSGDASTCACDFPRASLERAQPSAPAREISTLSRPLPAGRNRMDEASPARPAAEEPVYTVILPPLSFDANSPAPPPDPDPATILLIREVRMRSSAVYHGHVNPAPVQTAVARSAPPSTQNDDARAHQPQSGFFDRVKNFFRSL